MTEASFAFFILLSLWCLIKWFDNRKGIYGSGFVAFSGIAALTRPEGIGLLPAALAFAIYMVCKQKLRALHWIIIGLLPWIFQIFWHCKIVGKYGYGAELQGGIHQVTLSKFFSYMLLYPAYLPYIVSPFVFFFVIYGIYRSIRLKDGDSARKIYHLFMFYTVAAWILGLSFHWAWTTRFMFAIIALLLMFSGYGISCMGSVRSRKIALTLSVATSIAFTILVLVCSRGTFEDIRKSSYFIRDNVPPDAKIVSSEIAKIKFWSGRKVSKYNRAKLKPGMYVALQNLYCDFEQEMNYLKEKHDVEVVYRKKVTVVPLLSDEMHHRKVKRKDGTIALRGSGNRLISLRGQFSKHRFESAVILIKD